MNLKTWMKPVILQQQMGLHPSETAQAGVDLQAQIGQPYTVGEPARRTVWWAFD